MLKKNWPIRRDGESTPTPPLLDAKGNSIHVRQDRLRVWECWRNKANCTSTDKTVPNVTIRWIHLQGPLLP